MAKSERYSVVENHLCVYIYLYIIKPGAPGFLKLFLCGRLYVCLCVCPPPKLLITSGVIWHDMDPIRLVKQVLQLLYGNCSSYFNEHGLGIDTRHSH